VVVLDADVAAAFPDSRTVNRALRALLQARPARRRRAASTLSPCPRSLVSSASP